MANDMDFCDECRLNIDHICAKKIKACKIKVKQLEVESDFCSPLISSPSVCSSSVISNSLDVQTSCIVNSNIGSECVQNLNATNAGISNLVANDVCVPGRLRVANLWNCGKYRASVVYSMPTTYTLNSDLSFDAILDDPNGNVLLSPARYIVPVSGWYEVNLQVNISNLVPTPIFGPILGVPVANPQLYVNGVLVREIGASFLSFYPQQKTSLSTLLPLKVGDVLTMRYRVLALDAASGVVAVPGTVDIFGDGSDNNTSGVKIHLLSVDCPDLPCAPNVPCQPCVPKACVPCMPVAPGQPCGCDDNEADGMSSK